MENLYAILDKKEYVTAVDFYITEKYLNGTYSSCNQVIQLLPTPHISFSNHNFISGIRSIYRSIGLRFNVR